MSFPRYPRYKNSGVDWVGEVPSHWAVAKLKSFTTFSGGGTPDRENFAFWNGDIPWVSPKDMKTEEIAATEECITSAGLDGSATSLVSAGRVLLVVRSGILKHTIPVAINTRPVALNQDMKALHMAPDRCSSHFLLRWIQGLNDRLLIAWGKQGATVESIEHAYLANTSIPLPPAREQDSIVSFLDRETAKIDALVAEQERLVELLKEKRQAVISHAITKGLKPDVPMKASGVEGFGQVPAHWSVGPLRYVITKIEQGWSPQCENVPAGEGEWGVLKVGCGNGDHFDPTENKALPVALDVPLQYEVKAGDILMSRGNTPGLVGLATLVTEDQKRARLLLCDLLYRFRPRPDRAVGAYLVYLLRSAGVRFQLEGAATGTSPSMKKVSQAIISMLDVCVPPVEEQMAISRAILDASQTLDALVAKANQAIDLLQERRAALISAAVTGQIDVRPEAMRTAA